MVNMKLIEEFKVTNSFKTGKFKLSNGQESNFYIDARPVLLSSKGLRLACDAFYEILYGLDFDSIGGPAYGADGLVGALVSTYTNKQGWILRSEPKSHGLASQIVGKLGNKTVVLDDVATSGKSILKAVDYAKSMNSEVLLALCVVDRLEGAKEALRKHGVHLRSILTVEDFLE